MPTKAPKSPYKYRMFQRGPHAEGALSIGQRDEQILAERLAYTLRHPHSEHAVLIDIDAGQVLLHRVASGLPAQEVDHDGDAIDQ